MIATKNFTWDEITTHFKGNYGLNPAVSGLWALEYNIDETVEMLQAIRTGIGLPIYITSSYRCPKYNESIGGASSSMHLLFRALDFKVKRYKVMDYLTLAYRIVHEDFFDNKNFGLGVYPSFLHLDNGRKRTWHN